MELHFGIPGEVLALEAGGTETWNVMPAKLFRPHVLRGQVSGSIDDVVVESFRIGVLEQLAMADAVPLRVLLNAGRLTLPDVVPGLLVSIRLASKSKERLELMLWLEGDEIK